MDVLALYFHFFMSHPLNAKSFYIYVCRFIDLDAAASGRLMMREKEEAQAFIVIAIIVLDKNLNREKKKLKRKAFLCKSKQCSRCRKSSYILISIFLYSFLFS